MADELVGAGAFEKFVESLGVEQGSAAVLAGTTSFEASGAKGFLGPVLKRPSTSLVRVQGPLPSKDEVLSIAEGLSSTSPMMLIGVGGGLVLDTMKLVGFVLSTGTTPFSESYEPSGSPREIRTAAVPTTAGSGAERTPFAVVYVDGVKQSFEHPSVQPDVAVIDPGLSASMPQVVAAASGLDAFSHCVESLWACGSTPESREIAQSSLERIIASIEEAVVDRSLRAQSEMSEASSEAGRAIATSRTTAAHALSYHLTANHGVLHGHAVALTLGAVLVLNNEVEDSNLEDSRGVDHVRAAVELVSRMLGVDSAPAAAIRIKRLVASLGLPDSLDELGLTGSQVSEWIARVDQRRLLNNPRRLEPEDLERIVGMA